MPIELGPDTVWPPVAMHPALNYWSEQGVWYRGQPGQLIEFYQREGVRGYNSARPSDQARGAGLMNYGLARGWWGRPVSGTTSKVHIPAAADVSKLSADYLFAEPPGVRIPDAADALQERLEEIIEGGGLDSVLHEAAEQASAFGGVYLRGLANPLFADVPIAEVILPENAYPEWWGPFLRAVTFVRVLSEPTQSKVIRHIQRHEPGAVWHELREGSTEKLGRVVPITEHPETAPYAAMMEASGAVPTGIDVLDVVYMRNVGPNPLLSRVGPFGRSDYGHIDGFQMLDETWTSLMRDLRLGKARAFVPREYLRRPGGAGSGAAFDAEQEVFASINAQGRDDGSLDITLSQFEIRVDQHLKVASGIWRAVMRSAGLSADAFGEEVDGGAATAKEIGRRGERSNGTRAQKIKYATPAITRLYEILLKLDTAFFRGGAPAPVELSWPDASAPDPESVARTVQLLDAAAAASTRTKVQIVHRDWTDEQVDEEVELIEGSIAPPPEMIDPNAPPPPNTDPNAPPNDEIETDDDDDQA